ncbi:amidohydrolase [Candidatus Thorarchaeota archaeon]|nr:MAG: amidohydrolase [Candidatus Thorarchaeota archaeon]
MLIVRAIDDIPKRGIKKGDLFQLFLVDAHHHMGREKTHRNTPSGAYEFYASLWFELQKIAEQMIEEEKLLFEPIKVIGPPFASRCFESHDSWKRMNHGWLIDKTVVFPYTDDYSKPKSHNEASFKISNDKIAAWTTRAPHSTRLIGFARIDPNDELKSKGLAIKELERSVHQLGLRGLKMHPLAQLFIDSIEGEITKDIVKRAGELNIPVLFDTRSISTVIKIRNLVETMRNDPDCGTAIKGLRIILAHCGMSPGDSRLYEALKDPIIYAETSTLHDLDVPILFESAIDRLKGSEFKWSEKILFGTDFSFLSVQAADIILYLLSKKFPGTLADIQRILGGNILSIIKNPFSTVQGQSITPTEFTCIDPKGSGQLQLETTLLELINREDWDLCSLDLMLPPRGTWPEPQPLSKGGFSGIYLDSYVLCLKSRRLDRELHVWIRRQPGDVLLCSILNTHGKSSLDTVENASQSFNPVLLRLLSDYSISLPSSTDLSTRVVSYID